MKKIIYCIAFICLFVACEKSGKKNILESKSASQSNIIQLYQKADSLRETGAIDISLYQQFIEESVAFYEEYPEDPTSPKLLLDAGVACMTMAKYYKDFYPAEKVTMVQHAQKALDIFEIMGKVYPDYPETKSSLLNKAIVYDDILEDYRSAEYEYREYIHKYPTDSTSINLQIYLQYLGKSPEDIMAEFDSSLVN